MAIINVNGVDGSCGSALHFDDSDDNIVDGCHGEEGIVDGSNGEKV